MIGGEGELGIESVGNESAADIGIGNESAPGVGI